MQDILEIIQMTVAFGIYADSRRWDALEELFAQTVIADYTALNGGVAAPTSAAQLVSNWKAFLPGFSGTQHLIGTPLVNIASESATAEAEFVATHVINDKALAGRDKWILGGRYEMQFVKLDNRWKISRIKLISVWQSGNTALAQEAVKRAPK